MDWLEENYENLMSWDKNPWKIPRSSFGNHYLKLLGSKDPVDQAKAKEIRRLADALHQRLLERYPELAVANKHVPPERNGFLKLLELSARLDPTNTTSPFSVDIEKKLKRESRGTRNE